MMIILPKMMHLIQSEQFGFVFCFNPLILFVAKLFAIWR